jgi:polysaccharide biosynthesis/export protein
MRSSTPKWIACAASMLAFAVHTACAEPPNVDQALSATTEQSPARSDEYRITPGDKVRINVFGEAELSGEFVVGRDGNLRMPVVGQIGAADLTLTELERAVVRALNNGYMRAAAVSVQISAFRPIHVLGMVRAPGAYEFREGMPALAAIAQAGGIGLPEGQQAILVGELLQAEERVRLLEVNRAALTARRARLLAQQNNDSEISFPQISAPSADSSRLAQILDGEKRTFTGEREIQDQHIAVLQAQIPRLNAEIAALNEQKLLEENQRTLTHELVADYDKLMKSGLARKPTYIELKREEARIEGNIARVAADRLRAEVAIGEVEFRIGELKSTYRRRVNTELSEADRALLELSITLPSAQRTRSIRAQQYAFLRGEASEPIVTVIRLKGATTFKLEVAVGFTLQPGDIVQVGPLLPSVMDPMPLAQGGSSPAAATPMALGRVMQFHETAAKSLSVGE